MNRNFVLVLIAVFLLVGCAGRKPAVSETNEDNNLDMKLEKLTRQIIRSLSQTEKTKIAVIEFLNLDGEVTALGQYMAEELITRFYRTGKFDVIERQMLNKIIREHQLSLSGMVDKSSAQKLGKILGVDAITSGSITDLGSNIKINARLISTETGKIFAVASVNIAKNETVLALMNENVDSRPAEQSRGSSSKPKTINIQGYRIQLDSCTVEHNNRLVCHMQITNQENSDRDFAVRCGSNRFSEYGATRLYDNRGNEYKIGGVKYGNKYHKYKCLSQYGQETKKMISGVTVPLKLYFDDFSSDTREIAKIHINCGGEFEVNLEDIPVN